MRIKVKCRYEDCIENHPVASDDDRVTCDICRNVLGLPPLRVIRWTTVDLLEGEELDLLEGEELDLSIDESWTLWDEREIAEDNVKQGIADGLDRRLLRVELKVTRVAEEKL